MTRGQAIRKVLRCLRLAMSPNANEAATALRQARALMSEYGITDADASAAEYSESRGAPCARGAGVPTSIAILLNMIADGFRCTAFCRAKREMAESPITISVSFIGRGADPTIAAYAFDVLRRQLQRDRIKYIARVKKRANREARGEAFARGWVIAVEALFPAAEQSEQELVALKAAMQTMHPSTQELAPRKMGRGGKVKNHDIEAGYAAGKQAQLNKGVEGAGQRRIGSAR